MCPPPPSQAPHRRARVQTQGQVILGQCAESTAAGARGALRIQGDANARWRGEAATGAVCYPESARGREEQVGGGKEMGLSHVKHRHRPCGDSGGHL